MSFPSHLQENYPYHPNNAQVCPRADQPPARYGEASCSYRTVWNGEEVHAVRHLLHGIGDQTSSMQFKDGAPPFSALAK